MEEEIRENGQGQEDLNRIRWKKELKSVGRSFSPIGMGDNTGVKTCTTTTSVSRKQRRN